MHAHGSYIGNRQRTFYMNANSQSWLPQDKLGSVIPAYAPTYDFPAPYIDKEHRRIANLPLTDGVLIQMKTRRWFGWVIPGWLRREDALKLYELAHFAQGQILELGSFHGLSTAILARATRNAASPESVVSIDLDPACTHATRHNLKRLGVHAEVTAHTANAVTAVEAYVVEQRQFALAFIDHSHAYEPVYKVCRVLDRLIQPGGFCLFHDFNDLRNADPEDKEYGVYQAVIDGLNMGLFEFYGIFGCCGLYRRVT